MLHHIHIKCSIHKCYDYDLSLFLTSHNVLYKAQQEVEVGYSAIMQSKEPIQSLAAKR